MIKIESVILALPKDAQVLDIGCFGYGLHSLCHKCGRPDIKNCGVDYSASEDPPAGYEFKKIDLNRDRLPYPDAHFDFVLASHVIEHLRDGVAFFAECCRVTKLGGRVMITCPSERSITLSGFPFDHDKFCSTSLKKSLIPCAIPAPCHSCWYCSLVKSLMRCLATDFF